MFQAHSNGDIQPRTEGSRRGNRRAVLRRRRGAPSHRGQSPVRKLARQQKASLPAFDIPRTPPLRIEAEGLELTAEAGEALARLANKLGRASSSARQMSYYGGLLRAALHDHLLTQDTANALLARANVEGLEPLGTAINSALNARVVSLLAESPFPLGNRDASTLKLAEYGLSYDGHTIVHCYSHCHTRDLSALKLVSPEVRSWVWKQMNEAPVPCIDSLSILETSFHMDGMSTAMRKLANEKERVTEKHIAREFRRLLDCSDFDETEDGQPYHYGAGTLDDWTEFCTTYLPMYRQRNKLLIAKPGQKSPAPANRSEERWVDFGRRLSALRGWCSKKGIDFHFDFEEQLPIHQGNVLYLQERELEVTEFFFEKTNDNSGETPGVSFDLLDTDNKSSLVSFAFMPILTASVFGELESLDKRKKKNV